MSASRQLGPARLLAIFSEEIEARSGKVHDTFKDRSRLFTRSILPRIKKVRKNDRLQGGVALRATTEEIWLHPYVFRQVCSNGAIMAHALHSQHVTIVDWYGPVEAEGAFREAVGACCVEEAFASAVGEFRSAADTSIDMALNLAPLLSRLGARESLDMIGQFLRRFRSQPDRTRFGLVNAITSLARDTRDPESRWRLEELGGAIAAGVPGAPPSLDAVAEADHYEAVAVD